MPKQPKISERLKVEVSQKGQALVDMELRARYVKPPPTEPRFNYIVDVYTKWYRSYFYFCAQYAVPGPDAIVPSFEEKFARLTFIGGERFTLSFMRYTGQWVELYQEMSLDSCLEAIKTDPWFQL